MYPLKRLLVFPYYEQTPWIKKKKLLNHVALSVINKLSTTLYFSGMIFLEFIFFSKFAVWVLLCFSGFWRTKESREVVPSNYFSFWGKLKVKSYIRCTYNSNKYTTIRAIQRIKQFLSNLWKMHCNWRLQLNLCSFMWI